MWGFNTGRYNLCSFLWLVRVQLCTDRVRVMYTLWCKVLSPNNTHCLLAFAVRNSRHHSSIEIDMVSIREFTWSVPYILSGEGVKLVRLYWFCTELRILIWLLFIPIPSSCLRKTRPCDWQERPLTVGRRSLFQLPMEWATSHVWGSPINSSPTLLICCGLPHIVVPVCVYMRSMA